MLSFPRSRIVLIGAIAAFALAGLNAPGDAAEPAPNAAGTAFSADQKKVIEQIVRDYLIANPEVMIEVQQALDAKLEKQQADKLKTLISKNSQDIFRSPRAAVAGDPEGDITVVEFFDYNCGYCKRSLGEVMKLVDNDKKVRVVFKELPILSSGSKQAAKIALAARMQGKYWEFHKAMLTFKGQANEESALKIAEKLGLDVAQLKRDMESAEVAEELAKAEDLAQKMGINGTPHFLVGDRQVPGAPDDLFNLLEKHVAELRKQGCSYC